MAHDRPCPRCGRPLPADARPGNCPACLLRAGLEPGSEAAPLDASNGDEVTLGFEPTSPGRVLESLARSIGSIPRVLLPDTANDDRGVAVIKTSSDEMPPASERGDRYLLFGEIARGGMGAVLKGRDPDLGRDLAVKVLLEGHRDKPDLLRRFVEEAQIGGQLQHPGIVPVYELGTFADSRPYFTMKLVKGRTLAQLLKERGGPGDELPRFLGTFEQVCQTVAYAHARGVIHRDLKPTNVMVGSFGEVQVMDWGLAKVLREGGLADEPPAAEEPAPAVSVIQTVRSGSDADASQAGSALGTPAYMAPEQAGGDVERVDRRADVFGLGSILCEVLTGQPAYTGRSQAEVMRKAMRADTGEALARLDACGAGGELTALARECLAAEPEDRPRDAGVVADRIAGHLAGVQERLRAAERARAAADARAEEERKRRKLALALAAAVIALMAVGGTGAAMFLQQRREASARLEASLREVSVLRLQARTGGGDPAWWQAVIASADRARDLLGPQIDAGTREEVLTLVEEIRSESRAARQDADLLHAVSEVRWAVADERDGAGGDALYGEVFRGADLDVDTLGSGEAGARIRARPADLRLELAEALDDWAVRRRRARPEDQAGWGRLIATARAVDPDPARDRARAAWSERDVRSRVGHLLDLAGQPDLPWSPGILAMLADALVEAGRHETAVTLLGRAHTRQPRDARVNYLLARLLESADPPRAEEAIGYYTAAWALRPESGHALAHALEGRGRGEEARVVLADLLYAGPRKPRRPDDPRHYNCYSAHRWGSGSELNPITKKAWEESLKYLRGELAGLGPGHPDKASTIHLNLHTLLMQLGRPDEALAELREAFRLHPQLATPDNLRSLATESAFASFRKANLHGAIADCREAIRLQPRDVEARDLLASSQLESGDSTAALRSIRDSLQIDPGYIWSLRTLSKTLLVRGQFTEAVPALEQSATRLAAAGWNERSEVARRLLAEARSLAGEGATLGKLAAGLKGPEPPEALDLAGAAAAQGRPALAARLYAVVLAVSPARAHDLRAGARFRAACAAAAAGCGRGNDDPRPDEAARAGLRKRAMEWLRSDLELWTQHLDSGTEAARGEVREALLRWKADPDLAGIRDPEALAKLSAEEQEACRKLWADVDALLVRLEGGRP